MGFVLGWGGFSKYTLTTNDLPDLPDLSIPPHVTYDGRFSVGDAQGVDSAVFAAGRAA